MLNQSSSPQFGSSMHHVQTDPVQVHVQCGILDAFKMFASGSVKDSTRYIQAVTLHRHQNDWPQRGVKSKESLLRNNYGNPAVKHELSAALQPTGTQSKQFNQVRAPKLKENNDGEKAIDGQWPRSALVACLINGGANVGTPPRGNKRSLARRVGKALKRRDCSHTIGRHAQWTRQYNGVRYLLQYVHWQTVRPQLTPISEWEERIMNERLAQIAQSAEH